MRLMNQKSAERYLLSLADTSTPPISKSELTKDKKSDKTITEADFQ